MASSSPDEVHVLLVDDDRVTRTVVAGLLKKCRYQGMWRILGVLK
jgi:CheY-like chemotaxis protein